MLKEAELEFLRRLPDNPVDFIVVGTSAAESLGGRQKATNRDKHRMALSVLEATLKAPGEAPAHEQGPANGLRPQP